MPHWYACEIMALEGLANVEELGLSVFHVDPALALQLVNLVFLKRLTLRFPSIDAKAWRVLCGRGFDVLDVSNRQGKPVVHEDWLFDLVAARTKPGKLVHSFDVHGALNAMRVDQLERRGMEIEYVKPNTSSSLCICPQ
jgi:hypothetical protein